VKEQEVRLTVSQSIRYATVQRGLDGGLTNAEAARGLVHGNTGREPPNKTPAALQAKVVALATGRYARGQTGARGVPKGHTPASFPRGTAPRPVAQTVASPQRGDGSLWPKGDIFPVA